MASDSRSCRKRIKHKSPGVSVIYCSITDKHKFSGFNQYIFYLAPISMGQESRHGLAGSSAQGFTVQGAAGLSSHLEVQQRKDQLPSSLRLLEEFISLQLQDAGTQLPAGYPRFLAMWQLTSSSPQGGSLELLPPT